jgi:hypothetical protein
LTSAPCHVIPLVFQSLLAELHGFSEWINPFRP